MTTIVNTKLGSHRGKHRLWLEGQKLAREQYQPDQRFDVVDDQGKLALVFKDNGTYKVSRREKNGRITPVIDLKANELAELFDGVETLRVVIQQGRIVVTAHHQQANVQRREDRLSEKLKCGQAIDVCSLFHGGGCLDLALHEGFKQSGIKTRLAVAVEMESAYLDSSLRNNSELWDEKSIAIESPIQAVKLGSNAPEVDALFAGIPCTGASKSGRSKNKLQYAEDHEAAGSMFFNFLEFVKALNPAICLIENVPEYAGTSSMSVIRSVLTSLGYVLSERVLDGNEFGALEKRKRFCVVAVSKGIAPFDLDDVLPVRTKECSLNQILDEIPDTSERWKSFDYLAEKEGRDKAAGKGFSRQLLTGDEESCGTIGKDYAKCRSTEPFIINRNDPSKSRILTPAEHCRVKKIPEWVVHGLSDTVAHQILGQSIIFPVFEAVGKELGDRLWRWCGLNPIKVEVVDSDQPSIGGEDFHWAPMLADQSGRVNPTPVSIAIGMEVHFVEGKEGDEHIALSDPNGGEMSCSPGPCKIVPVEHIAGGGFQLDMSLM